TKGPVQVKLFNASKQESEDPIYYDEEAHTIMISTDELMWFGEGMLYGIQQAFGEELEKTLIEAGVTIAVGAGIGAGVSTAASIAAAMYGTPFVGQALTAITIIFVSYLGYRTYWEYSNWKDHYRSKYGEPTDEQCAKVFGYLLWEAVFDLVLGAAGGYIGSKIGKMIAEVAVSMASEAATFLNKFWKMLTTSNTTLQYAGFNGSGVRVPRGVYEVPQVRNLPQIRSTYTPPFPNPSGGGSPISRIMMLGSFAGAGGALFWGTDGNRIIPEMLIKNETSIEEIIEKVHANEHLSHEELSLLRHSIALGHQEAKEVLKARRELGFRDGSRGILYGTRGLYHDLSL
ncbi:MAG: hypothetical protein KDK51_11405, partial [Deltaproteobacteria bacterium]|nr:hypothetical protein [Deltaproteobacteria bacterium]